MAVVTVTVVVVLLSMETNHEECTVFKTIHEKYQLELIKRTVENWW